MLAMFLNAEQRHTGVLGVFLRSFGSESLGSSVDLRDDDQLATRLRTLKTSRRSPAKSGHQKWVSTAVTVSKAPSENGKWDTDPSRISTRAIRIHCWLVRM